MNGNGMRRREFVSLIGGAAAMSVLAPRVARAQAMPSVGFLTSQPLEAQADRQRAFNQGLKDSGYIEGDNVTIVYRSAENQLDRLPALADDLVRRRVSVIAALSPVTVAAAKGATKTIPIVFGVPEDPVKLGLVASLARPDGNLT